MSETAFVIHLERAHARHSQVEMLCRDCPIPVQIHYAIDGSAISETEILNSFRRKIYQPHYPFGCNPQEIAIFLSFRQVWKKILDGGFEFAAIFEDDAQINPDQFDLALDISTHLIAKLGVIQFQTRPPRPPYREIKIENDILCCEAKVVPLRCTAQLVSKGAAEQLLAQTQIFDRPIDTFLQLRGLTGQRIYSIFPSGVTEVSQKLGGVTYSAQRQKVRHVGSRMEAI